MYLTTALTDPDRARFPRFLTGIVRGWTTFAARRRKTRYVRISDFPLHLQRDIGVLDGHATPRDCDGLSIDETEAPTPGQIWRRDIDTQWRHHCSLPQSPQTSRSRPPISPS